jgi:hypothetical protein
MQIADFASPAFFTNPYPLYERLRAAGPLVNLMPEVWLSGRYSVVEALLRDPHMGRDFMARTRQRYGEEQIHGAVFQALSRMLLFMNPPHHTRLRGLLMKAFNAKWTDEFRRLAQASADKLIDGFANARAVDLVNGYAVPLPIEVICSLLNVPKQDVGMFAGATRSVIRALEMAEMSGAEIDHANSAALQLEAYFAKVLRQRRRAPGNDLVSLLLCVEEGDDRLSEEEILANIILLFIAGHETTAAMIGNALIAFYRHPEQLARVKADPMLLPDAVAECLRFDGSIQMTARTALEDIHIEGVHLHKGAFVYLSTGSANRDPARYADPDRFIIDRAERTMHPYTFGGGVHYCLGARLASIELEVALGTLFESLPDLQITNLGRLHWRQTNTFRGVESLMAAW